jgi:hypothetical protein
MLMHAGAVHAVSHLYGAASRMCTCEWVPGADDILEALCHLGYKPQKPSPSSRTARGSAAGKEEPADGQGGPQPPLLNVILLLRLLRAVCQTGVSAHICLHRWKVENGALLTLSGPLEPDTCCALRRIIPALGCPHVCQGSHACMPHWAAGQLFSLSKRSDEISTGCTMFHTHGYMQGSRVGLQGAWSAQSDLLVALLRLRMDPVFCFLAQDLEVRPLNNTSECRLLLRYAAR